MPVLEENKQVTISRVATLGSTVNPIGENVEVTPSQGYDAIKKITATVDIASVYWRYKVSTAATGDTKYCFISFYLPIASDPTSANFKQSVGEQTIIFSGGSLAGTSVSNRIKSCKVKDLVDGEYYTDWWIEQVTATPSSRWRICLEIQGHSASYDTIMFDYDNESFITIRS